MMNYFYADEWNDLSPRYKNKKVCLLIAEEQIDKMVEVLCDANIDFVILWEEEE